MGLFGGDSVEEIEKLAAKGKSDKIIKIIDKKNEPKEVIAAAIKALGELTAKNDEDSQNKLTDLLDSEDPEIRTAAAKAGIET